MVTLILLTLKSEESLRAEKEAEEKRLAGAYFNFLIQYYLFMYIINYINYLELKAEQEKPQEPSVAEIKPNKKILIEIKVEKKALGVIVVGGKNNHVKVCIKLINKL